MVMRLSHLYEGNSYDGITDSKIHGANMGPTWVLSAPGGPHVGPIYLVIRDPHAAMAPCQYLGLTH